MDKRINIISDSDGGQIVVITDICFKGKHNVDAKYGWYRFTTRFALPVYDSNTGELERFNIFRIEMLIRHATDGNLYLYDMVNIKKETSTPLEQ